MNVNQIFVFQEIDLESIVLNVMILIWIAVMYAVFIGNYFKNSLLKKVGLGIFVSSVSILIISVSYEMIDGYLFDTRTVLFSLSGLYLGFIPTIIIALFTMIYRIYLGDAGLYIGLYLIFISSSFGLVWRYFISKKIRTKHTYELLMFSIISGIIPFVSLLIWDFQLFEPHLGFIVGFYLALIPTVTFLLALILHKQKQIANLSVDFKEQSELLKIAINSPKVMEIYVLDNNYNYLLFNSYHEYCMKLYYGVDIKIGDSFLEYIRNSDMYSRFRSQIYKGLQGVEYSTVDEVETTRGKYYESMFTPIKSKNNEVIGVGIFSYDVTKRKQYEINLEYLNYHDSLTDVYNRRFYNENIIKYDSMENYPICLILADINSLKTVNDAFGHKAGDDMLIEAAQILKSIASDKGFVSRIGGDEFVILLKNTSNQMAENIIKEINHSLDKKTIGGVKLSMSIGYDVISSVDSINEAFKTAEDNMYTPDPAYQCMGFCYRRFIISVSLCRPMDRYPIQY